MGGLGAGHAVAPPPGLPGSDGLPAGAGTLRFSTCCALAKLAVRAANGSNKARLIATGLRCSAAPIRREGRGGQRRSLGYGANKYFCEQFMMPALRENDEPAQRRQHAELG